MVGIKPRSTRWLLLFVPRVGQALAVVGDVSLPETHDRLVAEAERSFGSVDIALNNAASVGPIKPDLLPFLSAFIS
jgi:NAD(P)-dependent dehydrogenase (short-subunit alcohol dehydrogenase family)